jgi:prolyl-tRNA synthetase
LVGIPFRINVGKKVSEGKVELVRRSTRESQDANIAGIAEVFQAATKQQ